MFVSPANTLKGNPERILALSAYEVEQQLICSKKVGRFLSPVLSKLDFDNVFDGTSLCLLQELSELEDGGCAEVVSVAFLAKIGVRSSNDGWLCHYRTKCKVVFLSDEPAPDQDRSDAQPIENHGYQGLFGKVPGPEEKEEFGDTYSDFHDGEFGEIYDSAWNVESEADEVPCDRYETDDNQKLLETFRINADDQKDISRQIGQFVDTSRYFVCVSTTENNIQVLWEKADQEKRKTKYADASRHISGVLKAREFTSSRPCRINRSGMAACLEKIKVWVSWHSVVPCAIPF